MCFLLVFQIYCNGSTGIAVGMATNIPSHNLGEVVDAILAVSKNPDITITELMDNYIPGPDFPTGAYILGRGAIKKAYETGNGLIVMRAKTDIEDIGSNKKAIIVTELPYMVNCITDYFWCQQYCLSEW